MGKAGCVGRTSSGNFTMTARVIFALPTTRCRNFNFQTSSVLDLQLPILPYRILGSCTDKKVVRKFHDLPRRVLLVPDTMSMDHDSHESEPLLHVLP